ncbi:unnamed protein product [Adineta ricciae]|uniref:Uncharacterized protein n=1 Tax=Adineta ricciae TaxID=249248 RepID=A0A815KH74_ADIRI|nr:unnamed protein product [Adineta ricciae]CAF1395577.1 unnamed protein product [Adineta ricciae]
MDQNDLQHLDDEEQMPDWVIEIREGYRRDMEILHQGVLELRGQLNQCLEGIERTNDDLKRTHQLQVDTLAQLRSVDAEIDLCKKKMDAYDQQLTVYQEKIAACNEQIKECDEKIKECDEQIKECDEKIKECDEQMAVNRAGIKSCNAILERERMKREVGMKELAEIEKKIEAAKLKRARIDAFFNNLIEKEKAKRGEIDKVQCSKVSLKKSSRKRLNSKGVNARLKRTKRKN